MIQMSSWFVLFLFIIAAYGISNMMVFGSGPFRIFERIRYWSGMVSEHFGLLFSCMMCFPANVGWIVSLIDWFLLTSVALTPFNMVLEGTNLWWVAMIGDCCFTSGIVWLIHHIESFFENLSVGSENEDVENSEE